MAVSHTETQNFDHRSHPPDTEPFEGAFVPDSEETQLVDDWDFSQKNRTGVLEYGEEVVLDSEDDEVNGSRTVGVKMNVLSSGKLVPHRDHQSGAGQVSGISLATTERGKDEGTARLTSLNYADSQESEESSQVKALHFVDRFVSLNDDLSGSPRNDDKNTARVKSPPVSSTKGSQRLARMIELGSPIEKANPFEWDNPVEDRWVQRSNKKKMESSVVGHQKVKHVDDEKCISLSGERKTTQSLHRELTVSEWRIENQSANKLEGDLDTKSTGLQLEVSATETDRVDMFSVGFDTQLAAEAMEALAFGDHPDCNSAYAYQGMKTTADVVSGNAMQDAPVLEHHSLPKSCFSKGGINKNVKQRKRSTRIARRVVSSAQKQDSNLAALTKMKKSRFIANCSNSADANGNLCGQSPKPTKRRKVESATEVSELGVLADNLSLPLSVGGSLLLKEKSQQLCKESSVSHQISRSISGGSSRDTEHGPNNPEERKNNAMEDDGILKYRRKKRRLNASPSEITSATEGGSNEQVEKRNRVKKDVIITYQRKKRTSAKENCSKFCVSSEGDSNRKTTSLISDLLIYHPKGKRTRLNVPSNSCIATVLYTPPTVDGKESSSHCDERPDNSNDTKGKAQPLLHNSPPQNTLNNDSDRILLALQSGKPGGTDPTSLVDVIICIPVASSGTAPSNSTTGINVGSSKCVSDDFHSKPCSKNFPKSSLSKELIGLGIPECTPDFTWKDLRRRRNMAYVQVLFSQHLDNDILKQQKKVIARLGLSIASCSMDATHFIADQFARTRNMLEFIALGKPVVTHLWLESCGQANCLISEKSYILRDAKKEKEMGFSMLVSLDCAKRCPLLKDRKVLITPNVKPNKETVISLVKAVQGQPVEKVQISAAKTKKSFEDLLIISCEEDHAICRPFLDKGAAVYSSELVLNGIVVQKLEYKRHRLFTTDAKRNCA